MQVLGLGNDGNIIRRQTIGDAQTSFVGIAETLWVKNLSIQFITSNIGGAFTGTWLVEGSNNYAPSAGDTNFGQPTNAGTWTDITAAAIWSPAITAAVNSNTTQGVQTVPAGFAWRHIRITLTRTSGAGTSILADVWLCGKGS